MSSYSDVCPQPVIVGQILRFFRYRERRGFIGVHSFDSLVLFLYGTRQQTYQG